MFPRAEGRGAIEQSFASLFRIFPDWEITFEEPCGNDHHAMVAARVRATQKGEFMGIQGFGRRIEFDCVLIFDVQDGLITKERRIYDFTGMLIQLGVLRGKPAV
jgi:predicted ester cyclase